MNRQSEATFEAKLPDRLPQVRRSLRAKAIVAVTALIALPTMLTGYLTHREANTLLKQTLIRDSTVLAQTTGRLFEACLANSNNESFTALSDDLMKHLMQDERISFLVVTDKDGRVLAHRYNEPLAWHVYQSELTPHERKTPLTLNRSIMLDDRDLGVLVVRRQLLRRPELVEPGSEQAGEPRFVPGVGGYLELGLQDPLEARMLLSLQDVTFSLVGGICLVCLPLAVWWVRRWTRPLEQMVRAALRLGMGGTCETLPVNRDDEVGLLAQAFNAMAINLTSIQQALVQANSQLEQKVAQRTEQLERAKNRLEREIADKDQFLRAVSHDLGAPLRNIEGLATMLMLKHRARLEEDAQGKLERIVANVRAETELIGDLMELSRIKSRPGRRAALDLNKVLKVIADSLSYDLERKGITLTIDAPLPHVHAERNRMRQVFQNLLDNAIKYMPADASVREIHVGCEQRDGENVFYVRDTGVGVPEADHARIFQVFRRGRRSGQDDAAGRGIGLASVKAIVEKYGGRIWVESTPPHGATFLFTIDAQHIRPADADSHAEDGHGRPAFAMTHAGPATDRWNRHQSQGIET